MVRLRTLESPVVATCVRSRGEHARLMRSYKMRHFFPFRISDQDIRRRIRKLRVHFVSGPAQVWGENDIGQAQERMPWGQRFYVEDIEPGATEAA